jgi:hypothetical protein
MSQGLSRLYKDVLKAASGFKDKNFREYFTRIAKDDFERVSKTMPETEFVKVQTEGLEALKRQVEIQNMYYTENFTVKR